MKKYFINVFVLLLIIDISINGEHFFYTLKDFFYWTYNIQIKQIIIVINYLIQITILLFLLFSKNKLVRIFSYIFLFFTFSIFLTYFFINGYGFTINEANTALSNIVFINEAWNNFSSSIFLSIIISTIFLIFIYFYTKKYYIQIKTYISISLFSSLIVIYILAGATTLTMNSRLFFIPYKVVFNFYNALEMGLYQGEKSNVLLTNNKSIIDKIVFIVDESIVGSKLSLNGFYKNTTPFLNSNKDKFLNYGISSAGANCSNTSNTILRTGLQPNLLPDKNFKSLRTPNIWAYAKKAGYYTVYIDGQNESNKPQNYMNRYDLKSIDKYIQIKKEYPSIEYYNIDFKIIKVILKELKSHKKIFIYVNKLGAHFHYEDTYPKNKKFFKPTLLKGEAPEFKKKTNMLNSYYNSIRWSVDLWWEKLYNESKRNNVLYIYTSDHGQNLFDNNSKQTHCSKEPVVNEGNTPLLLIPMGNTKKIINSLTYTNFHNNINHCTHFNIFPTILYLEGYILKDKSTLFDNLSTQKRYFYSGDLWGRFLLKKHNFYIDSKNIKGSDK